jgi:hypothetical protein
VVATVLVSYHLYAHDLFLLSLPTFVVPSYQQIGQLIGRCLIVVSSSDDHFIPYAPVFD